MFMPTTLMIETGKKRFLPAWLASNAAIFDPPDQGKGIADEWLIPSAERHVTQARLCHRSTHRYCPGSFVFMTGVVTPLTWYLWQVRQSCPAMLSV
jgi:hypothetical protein